MVAHLNEVMKIRIPQKRGILNQLGVYMYLSAFQIKGKHVVSYQCLSNSMPYCSNF